jgi:hypothetical protein
MEDGLMSTVATNSLEGHADGSDSKSYYDALGIHVSAVPFENVSVAHSITFGVPGWIRTCTGFVRSRKGIPITQGLRVTQGLTFPGGYM